MFREQTCRFNFSRWKPSNSGSNPSPTAGYSPTSFVPLYIDADRPPLLVLCFRMRYLVKAKLKRGQSRALTASIDNGSLGQGSIAGDEYISNMNEARLGPNGVAIWVETCFCSPPLAEERPYWEQYFDLLSVKDAHWRRNCRHENGAQPWACCDCDCTKKLEDRLANQGRSFLESLRATVARKRPFTKPVEGD